jgi:hypothetical protein
MATLVALTYQKLWAYRPRIPAHRREAYRYRALLEHSIHEPMADAEETHSDFIVNFANFPFANGGQRRSLWASTTSNSALAHRPSRALPSGAVPA